MKLFNATQRAVCGVLLICFVLSGCASEPTPPFKWPSAGEVRMMIETGPKKLPQGIDYYTPDSWLIKSDQTVVGPQSKSPQTPVEEALFKAIQGFPNIEMTKGQTCHARERRRAELAYPNESLSPVFLNYIRSRCGATKWDSYYTYVVKNSHAPLSPGWQDSKVDAWLGKVVQQHAKGRWVEAGIAALQKGKHTEIFLITSTPDVKIRPREMRVGDEKVEVVGQTYLRSPGSISAAITQGAIGNEYCRRDWNTELPRFRFVCNLNTDDEFATITLHHGEEGTILRPMVADFIVGARHLPPLTFVPSEVYAVLRQADLDKTKDFQAQLLDAINYLRRVNGLGPLSLEVKQSEVIAGLIPSVFSDDPETANQAYLAMEAGWEVEGRILDFGYDSSALLTLDVVDHLGWIMSSGSGRDDIFKPEAVSVGIGVRSKGKTTSTVVGTYSTIRDESVQRRAGRVLDVLNKARKDAGKKPFELRRGDQIRAVEVSDEVMSGDLDSEDVCSELFSIPGARHCYWGWSRSLSEFHVSKPLLNEERESITISVTVEEVPNSPHWQYRVWVVAYR